MESLQRLLLSELGIPVWQLGLFVGLISFFVLTHRIRVGLIAAYLLTLYWGFYVFRAYLFSVAGGDFLASAAYIFFGFSLAGLSIYTLFYFREGSYHPGFPGFEISRLRRALLKRIDQMETAVLQAEARAVDEIRQFEELKQRIETKIGPLENQVQKIDGVLGQREFAVQGLEKGLLTRLHDLENQLRGKEELLQSRDKEIQGLRSEMEEQSLKLQVRLQEEEEKIRRESSWREEEENLHAAIHDLEGQLTKKEALLLARSLEIRDLRLEGGEGAQVLDGQLQALKAELAGRESSFKEKEEGLTARVHGLEEELRERETELKRRDQEMQNLRSDLENQLRERGQRPRAHSGGVEFLSPDTEVKLSSLQALLKEQEESFARRAASYKEVVESLTSRIDDLESQLKEREVLSKVHWGRSTG